MRNGSLAELVTTRIHYGGGPPKLQNPNGEGSNGVDQHERILADAATSS